MQGVSRCLVGDDAELALQHRRAVVVGADGSGAVTEVGLQLHEGAVARFLQRLQRNPAPCRGDGCRQLTSPPLRLADDRAQVDAIALQLLAKLEHPVVIVARKELAAIGGDGGGAVGDDGLVVTVRIGGEGDRPLGLERAQVDLCWSSVSSQLRSVDVTTSEGCSPSTCRR